MDPLLVMAGEGHVSTTNQVYIGTVYRNKTTTKPLVPIRVMSELTTTGVVMLIRMADGVALWNGLPLVDFSGTAVDGSNTPAERMASKFLLLDDEYELSNSSGAWDDVKGTHGTLPTNLYYDNMLVTQEMDLVEAADVAIPSYHVRIGDAFFQTCDQAMLWISSFYLHAAWRYDSTTIADAATEGTAIALTDGTTSANYYVGVAGVGSEYDYILYSDAERTTAVGTGVNEISLCDETNRSRTKFTMDGNTVEWYSQTGVVTPYIVQMYNDRIGDTEPLDVFFIHNSVAQTSYRVSMPQIRLLSETTYTKAAIVAQKNNKDENDDGYEEYSQITYTTGAANPWAVNPMDRTFFWESDGDYTLAFDNEIELTSELAGVFTVNEGASLTFGDGVGYFSVDANYQETLDGPFIRVDGTLTVNTNSTLQSGRNASLDLMNTSNAVGGIVVDGIGTLNLLGTIMNCGGVLAGGVAVVSNTATANIYGGSIINNQSATINATNGQAGYVTCAGAIWNADGKAETEGLTWFYLDGTTTPIGSLAGTIAVGDTFTNSEGTTYVVSQIEGTIRFQVQNGGTDVGFGQTVRGGDVTLPWQQRELHTPKPSIPNDLITWFYATDGTVLGYYFDGVAEGDTITVNNVTYTISGTGPDFQLVVDGNIVGSTQTHDVYYVTWGFGGTVRMDEITWLYISNADDHSQDGRPAAYFVGTLANGDVVTADGVTYTIAVDGTTGAITWTDSEGRSGTGAVISPLIANNSGIYGGIANSGTLDIQGGTIENNTNPSELLEITATSLTFADATLVVSDNGGTCTFYVDGAMKLQDKVGDLFTLFSGDEAEAASTYPYETTTTITLSDGTTHTVLATSFTGHYLCLGGSRMVLNETSSHGLADGVYTVTSYVCDYSIATTRDKSDYYDISLSDGMDCYGTTGDEATTGTVSSRSSDLLYNKNVITIDMSNMDCYVRDMSGLSTDRGYPITRQQSRVDAQGNHEPIRRFGVAGVLRQMDTDGTTVLQEYHFHSADILCNYSKETGKSAVELTVVEGDIDTISTALVLDGSWQLICDVQTEDCIRNDIGIWQNGTMTCGDDLLIDSSNIVYLDRGHIITVTEELDLTVWKNETLDMDSYAMEPGTVLIDVELNGATPEENVAATAAIMDSGRFAHIRTQSIVQDVDAQTKEPINTIVIKYASLTYHNNRESDPQAYTVEGYITNQEVVVDTFSDTGLSRVPGRMFFAWNTKADGTGDWYYPNQSDANTLVISEATVDLYAQWTGNVVNTLDDEITPCDDFRSLREAIIIAQYSDDITDQNIMFETDPFLWEQYVGTATVDGTDDMTRTGKDNKSGITWSDVFADDMTITLGLNNPRTTSSTMLRLSSNTEAEVTAVMEQYLLALLHESNRVSTAMSEIVYGMTVDALDLCMYDVGTLGYVPTETLNEGAIVEFGVGAFPYYLTQGADENYRAIVVSGTGEVSGESSEYTIFTLRNGYSETIDTPTVDAVITLGGISYIVLNNSYLATVSGTGTSDGTSTTLSSNGVTETFSGVVADKTVVVLGNRSYLARTVDSVNYSLIYVAGVETATVETTTVFSSVSSEASRHLTVDAAENSRHMNIRVTSDVASNPVSFTNLNFVNGHATNGGSFFVYSGDVTFTSCQFLDNKAVSIEGNNSTGNGGAIANTGGSVALRGLENINATNVEDYSSRISTTVYMETRTLTDPVAVHGGGVYNCNTLIVEDTDIFGLSVTGSGGGIFSSYNGSLNSDGEVVGTLANCEITRSLVDRNSAGQYGGGIMNFGQMTILGSEILRNQADLNGGGICNAFAITTDGVQSRLETRENVRISQNKALGTSNVLPGKQGFSEMKGGYGGGVLNGSLFVANATVIADNTAKINGAGVSNTVYNAAFTDSATLMYGTMEIGTDTTQTTTSVISGNVAGAYGGGIGNWGSLILGQCVSVTNNESPYGADVYNHSKSAFERLTVEHPNTPEENGNIAPSEVGTNGNDSLNSIVTASQISEMSFKNAEVSQDDSAVFVAATVNGICTAKDLFSKIFSAHLTITCDECSDQSTVDGHDTILTDVEVLLDLEGNDVWTCVGTFETGVTSWNLGLCAGTYTFNYRLRTPDGVETPTEVLELTINATEPQAPGEVLVVTDVENGCTSVHVSWNAIMNASCYKLERSLDGVSGWVEVDTTDRTVFVDTGLTADTTYYYRVIASNSKGDSDPSVIVTVTTDTIQLSAGLKRPSKAYSVAENAKLKSNVGSVTPLTRAQRGQTYTFTLLAGSEYFTIDANGKITTIAGLDFESTPSVDIVVQTSVNGVPTWSDTFTVNITNVDEAPVDVGIVGEDGNIASTVDLTEGSLVVGTLSATDPDGTAITAYKLSGNDAKLFVVVKNGDVFELRAKSAFDFENPLSKNKTNRYEVVINATDSTRKSSGNKTPLIINVTDKIYNKNDTVELSGSGNAWSIKRSGDTVHILNGRNVVFSEFAATFPHLSIQGTEKKDTFTFDLKTWNTTIDVDITFNGMGDSDTIKIVGTSESQTYLFTSESVVIGETTINLMGTEILTLDGGDGNDTYRFTGLAANTTTISDKKGVDTFDFSDSAVGVTLNLANTKSQSVFGQSLIVKTAPEILIGTDYADTLSGNRSGNVIYGGGGSDTICAVGGKNVLIGGAAADAIFGSSGEDLLVGDDVDLDMLSALDLYNGWIASKAKFDARTTSLERIGSAIVNDDSEDSLTGGKGQDWFFGEDDQILDFDETSRSPDRRN